MIISLFRYFKVKYILIYILFFFFLIVSFGGGVGANYTCAPYLFLISIFCINIYSTKRNQICKNSLLRVLVWMAVAIIVFSWNFFFYKNTIGNYCEYVSYSLLPVFICFAFYKFASKGIEELNLTLSLFVIFYIIAIVRFFHEKEAMILNGLSYGNNNFYMLVTPLPILLIIQNRLLRFSAVIITALLCMISLKRSALIFASLSLLIFLWSELKNSLRAKITIIIFVFLSFIIIYNFADVDILYDSFNQQIDRLEQIQQDGGSGRTTIIEGFFENDVSDVTLINGQGFMGYHNKYPHLVASHNDLLELYYSYGIFGIIIFITFASLFIKKGIKSVHIHSRLALPYSIAIVILLLYSLLSGLFTFVSLSLPFFSFIGISQAYSLIYDEK